jgi:RNA polymerase sigma-32 factor
MSVLNWHYIAEEDEVEHTPKVSNAFHRMVHALSRGGRVKFLEHDQENELILAWRNNKDQSALQKLLQSHDPMILAMAHKLAGQNKVRHYTDDIYQTGQAAFIKALDRYDIDEGNRLATFVKYSLTGEMMRFAMDMRMPMRTSTSAGERRAYYRYRAAIDIFTQNAGHEPGDTPADLAAISAQLGVSQKAFQRARQTHTAQIIPVHKIDVWADETSMDDLSAISGLLQGELEALSENMTPRNATIARSVLKHHDVAEAAKIVAEFYDLTPERIRQIVREALRNIRASLQKKGMASTADVMDIA